MLGFVIKDINGQPVSGKFCDIVVTIRVLHEDEENTEEVILDIVWFNSRRTTLHCSVDECDRFMAKKERYYKWLEKNPYFEQANFDMSILKEVLNTSISKSVEDATALVNQRALDLHKELTEKVLDNENSYMKKTNQKISEITENTDVILSAVKSLAEISEILKSFSPTSYNDEMNAVNSQINSFQEDAKSSET